MNEGTPEKDIRVHVVRPERETVSLDLGGVFSQIAQRKRFYGWLLLLALFLGLIIGLIILFFTHIGGGASYSRALVSYSYKGVENGLDPNGARLDVNKIKSPYVITGALDALGMSGGSEMVEGIRSNIRIEGVVPEDAIERITVINEMAQEDPTQYEKLLDVTYYPSQYIVYLYDDWTIPGGQVDALLNAILESYREYFYDTYANNDVLTVTMNLSDGKIYDYGERVDMIRTQLRVMLDYVNAKKAEKPDFRSANTGLSFGDIAASIQFIRDVDLNKLSSFIVEHSLSRDKGKQIDYYRYRIRQYNLSLAESQSELNDVNKTLTEYEKDPVVIVSSQESVQEVTRNGEYYDSLIQRKLNLTDEIARLNTDLNYTYTLLNSLLDSEAISKEEDYVYADGLLADLESSVREWVRLTEETTTEYYETTLFSNAFQVAVPARYVLLGGNGAILKTLLGSVAACVGFVVFLWCVDGVRRELRADKDRKKNPGAQA